MGNVIEQIIEIDQNARQKLQDAMEQKSCILLQAHEDEEKIRDDFNERANKRLAIISETEKANADEKIEVIKTHTSEIIKNLNDTFEENHEKWESEIFNNIVNI